MGEFLKSGLVIIVWLTVLALPAAGATTNADDARNEPPPLPEELRSKGPMIPPGLLPDPSELFAQLEQLSELMALSHDELHQLRQTIEFIERLSPEEREAMRLRLARITEVSPARKAELNNLIPYIALNNLIPYIAPRFHSDLSQLWMAASEEERTTIQKELKPLSNKEKGRYLMERVEAFIKYRESVFAELQMTLENKNDTGKNQAIDNRG
jgi:hypothetical protein